MKPKKAQKQPNKEPKQNPFELRKKPKKFPVLNERVKAQESAAGQSRARAFEKVIFAFWVWFTM